MGVLEWLLGQRSNIGDASRPSTGDTDTVRRIVAELDRMDRGRARYLAAFAYVLGRIANADLHISEAETDRIVALVSRVGHLPDEQAVLVTQIAKSQNELFGGTENFLVTREFKEIATAEQRTDLLDCLFAVSAADDAVSGEEEAQIRQVAGELGFSHTEYVEARLKYSDKRTVLRKSQKP